MSDATKAKSVRVTQLDVARAAGVSKATVSYVLNDNPGVSDDVRRRVLEVVSELAYRPNRTAQGLRRGRMNMIGLLLADIANPFYPELASAIVATSAAHGNQVFLAQVGLGGAMQTDAVRNLVDRGCDGLVFTSVVAHDAELLNELRKERVPFVYANRRVESVPADWVHIDDSSAAYDIANVLLNDGRERVAILGGPAESTVSAARTGGAMKALDGRGLSPLSGQAITGDLTRASGAERMRALLEEGPVDGVICGNDMIALGVIDVCRERGIAIPDDLAVVGFDDMSFASAGPLQLTTVTVPRQLMGQRAVEMLIERIEGYEGDAREEVLPYEVQVRGTTGGDGTRRNS